MLLFFAAFSYEFSHESVLSDSCLISNNFPLNLLFIRSTLHWLNLYSLGSSLPGYIFCMKSTLEMLVLANCCIQVCSYHLCI